MDSNELIKRLEAMGLEPYAFTSYRALANVVAVKVDDLAGLYRLGQALIGFDMPEIREPRIGYELYWPSLKWPPALMLLDPDERDRIKANMERVARSELGGKVDHGEPDARVDNYLTEVVRGIQEDSIRRITDYAFPEHLG